MKAKKTKGKIRIVGSCVLVQKIYHLRNKGLDFYIFSKAIYILILEFCQLNEELAFLGKIYYTII